MTIARDIARSIANDVSHDVTSRYESLLQQIQGLFSSSDGAFFVNNPDTMYQDSAGLTVVTAADDPVGLWVDQSHGGESELGEDVAANGDFLTDAGWTKGTGWSISAGAASCSGAQGAGTNLAQDWEAAEGETWVIEYTVTSRFAGSVAAWVSGDTLVGTFFASAGTYRYVARILGGGNQFGLRANASFVGSIDNITARKLAGNHATQVTNGERPLLKQPSVYVVDYDESDDNHIVAFSNSLGDECTVAYAVAGVGTTILTAQTIGTSHTIDTDNCGYFIIDRALSASETSIVTTYLNSLAGA